MYITPMVSIERETPAKPLREQVIDLAISSTIESLDLDAPAPTKEELAKKVAERARAIAQEFGISLKKQKKS